LALRELLDDERSDEWAQHSRTGLKLDEVFLHGADPEVEYISMDKGVMRFRIATERFERKRTARVG